MSKIDRIRDQILKSYQMFNLYHNLGKDIIIIQTNDWHLASANTVE